MIVVDSSVWIDLLNGNETQQVRRCEELLRDGAPLALTDIVFTEVLQGVRKGSEARTVARYLRAFPILRLADVDDFEFAADLFRTARRAGVNLRNALDCLIATACMKAHAPILHSDADFDRLASCTPLQIFT